MADIPKVDDAKTFLILLLGAFIAGIVVAALYRYEVIQPVERSLSGAGGKLRLAA